MRDSAVADVTKTQTPQVRLAHLRHLEYTCDFRTLRLLRRHAQLEQTFSGMLANLPLLFLDVRVSNARVECHWRDLLGKPVDRKQVVRQLRNVPHVSEHTLLDAA